MANTHVARLVPLLIGVVTAIAFAGVLRLFPEEMFLDTGKRIVMFALAALAAPPTVFAVRRLARPFSQAPGPFLYAANTGAVAFDGIATGFAPQVYGHQGPASHVVLAVIVFGLFSILLVDQIIPARERENSR